ncbi:MAG TPA: ABC transporter ATP-binding protein [Polyangiaceae bacterium]|nr:ABC transporter ATP-binding protein [Polyangiaceae bacterium]
MSNIVLQLQNVRKTYGEGTPIACEVLHGIDMDVRGGELTALIGPSGSGKSTLLNLLGLLDRASTGTILLDGVNTTELDPDARTRLRGEKIGFVFQFHQLLPAFTALENVLLPAQAQRRWRTHAMVQRARTLLEQVGLAELCDRKATELSGGQQQRVAVARALMMNPPLLLADEPTGNLDTGTADQVFDLLRRLLLERGSAALVVTHDPRLAERADRVLMLVDGRIVSDVRRQG